MKCTIGAPRSVVLSVTYSKSVIPLLLADQVNNCIWHCLAYVRTKAGRVSLYIAETPTGRLRCYSDH